MAVTKPVKLALFLTLFSCAASGMAFGQDSRKQDPAQTDTVRVETSLVTVPVIVTDRYGRFTTGLTRQDFAVSEDGVRQELASFSSIEAPFNVALLIDTSRSTRTKLGAIRRAALNFIKQLQPQDRVLIVTFDEQVRFISNFTNNRGELERAVRSVKSSYLTSLYDAIQRTITEKLQPIQGRKAIVVLTDGVDTYSRQATYQSALDLVSQTGVICYAIQYETRNEGGSLTNPFSLPTIPPRNFVSPFVRRFGQPPQQEKERQVIYVKRATERDRYLIATDFLRELAVRSGALHMRAESIESTSYAFVRIADELRHQYTLTYYSTNDRRDGGFRRIAVNLQGGELSVRARQGYLAPKETEGAKGENREPTKPPTAKP